MDLNEIQALADALPDAPWRVEESMDGTVLRGWLVGYATDNPDAGLVAEVPDYGYHIAQWIAAARTAVPELVAEVRALRAEVEALRARRSELDTLLAAARHSAEASRAERDQAETASEALRARRDAVLALCEERGVLVNTYAIRNVLTAADNAPAPPPDAAEALQDEHYWHASQEVEAEARVRGDLDPRTVRALSAYLRGRAYGITNDATEIVARYAAADNAPVSAPVSATHGEGEQ